jgi:LacI family transcriptional regulator
MATIKEVAKKAGVSVATVSNVLNQRLPVSAPLRERVLKAARELDYHPDFIALSLKARQTRTLGMIIPDISNPYFPLLVRGAESVALAKDYLLIAINTDDDIERERKALSLLRSRKVDGLLLVTAPGNGTPNHILDLIKSGVPTVCLDRRPANVQLDSVLVDNLGGARICVRHLLERGFGTVAMVSGPPTLETAQQRLLGYRTALKEFGKPVDPKLIVQSNFRESGGFDAAVQLLKLRPRPEAVFIANGMMTLGFLHGMSKEGVRCPEDMAIAAFDDLPFSDATRPSLTCVAQPAFEVGRNGAELLLARLEKRSKGSAPAEIILPTELRIRESSQRFHNRAKFR